MLRLLKTYWWIFCLCAVVPSASAFSMWGQREPYHVGQLSYIADFTFTPKNLGEEYRWNVPTLYYTYDQAFLDYFGSNGVAAIDQAIAILNNLTNVSNYSADLSEFPLESTRINWTASAMHLYDLKSGALEILIERLGLTDPERFTWTLRNRALPPGASCPAFVYTVIKRNFDPVTLAPSSYVNGNLYTYSIVELCPTPDQADAVEQLVDPLGIYESAVATPKMSVGDTFFYGYFYNGLTRDDVGGLRYLYNADNRNVENAGPGTFTYVTNTTPQLLSTTNLTLLSDQALTNDAPTLAALYPGLSIIGSTNFFTNIYATNITAYLTNYPWDPAGFLEVAFATNVTVSVATYYRHTFGNLLGISNTPSGWMAVPMANIPPPSRAWVSMQTTTVGVTNPPYAPVGTTTIATNTSTVTYMTNLVMGDFVLMPTNQCTFTILYSQLTNVLSFTNPITFATNFLASTNIVGSTLAYTQNLITYFTNHVFVIYPVQCLQSNVSLRQGVEKIRFVRRDFDSLFNRYWYPITNTYAVTVWTNNGPVQQIIQRVLTAPDIVFSAADLVTGPTAWPIIIPTCSREVPILDSTGATNGNFGPGTMESSFAPGTFQFNKVGPIFINNGPFFIDEKSAYLDFIWASFDGTTNAPVVYPIGTSITNLVNQMFLQFSPAVLPAGAVSVPYWVQFAGSGGQPPYTWSLSPNSAGLPPGFDPLLPDGTIPNGVISGTPSQAGIFDISIRITDSGGRFVDRPMTITISP